jgi:hypothetical protein
MPSYLEKSDKNGNYFMLDKNNSKINFLPISPLRIFLSGYNFEMKITLRKNKLSYNFYGLKNIFTQIPGNILMALLYNKL